jgi:hypothetical protein
MVQVFVQFDDNVVATNEHVMHVIHSDLEDVVAKVSVKVKLVVMIKTAPRSSRLHSCCCRRLQGTQGYNSQRK